MVKFHNWCKQRLLGLAYFQACILLRRKVNHRSHIKSGLAEKEGRLESFNTGVSSYKDDKSDLRAPAAGDAMSREMRELSGYDSASKPSTTVPMMADTAVTGATERAPDTMTSGTVSGEAWERDRLTGASEGDLEARLAQSRGTYPGFEPASESGSVKK
jgi:hypothetical protein